MGQGDPGRRHQGGVTRQEQRCVFARRHDWRYSSRSLRWRTCLDDGSCAGRCTELRASWHSSGIAPPAARGPGSEPVLITFHSGPRPTCQRLTGRDPRFSPASLLDDLYAKLRALGPALLQENKALQAAGAIRDRLEALARG